MDDSGVSVYYDAKEELDKSTAEQQEQVENASSQSKLPDESRALKQVAANMQSKASGVKRLFPKRSLLPKKSPQTKTPQIKTPQINTLPATPSTVKKTPANKPAPRQEKSIVTKLTHEVRRPKGSKLRCPICFDYPGETMEDMEHHFAKKHQKKKTVPVI